MSYRHENIIASSPETFYSGSGIFLGHSISGKKIFLDPDTLQRHLVILGKTGTGKSNMLKKIVGEIIEKKLGSVVLLDPHGDTAQSIASRFPGSTLVLSPYTIPNGTLKTGITINPLYSADRTRDSSVISGWVRDAFSSEYSLSQGTWGPRLELIFTSLLNQLILVNKNCNLGDLLNLLTDPSKLRLFLKDVKDDNLRQFLKAQMSDWRGWNQYVSSSINKLLPVIGYDGLRNISSGRVDSVDLFEYLQEDSRLLIPEFWRGVTSEENYRIISVLLLLKIWMLRINANEGKLPIYIVADEAHILSENIIDRFLREGRKFDFRLIIATQFIGKDNDRLQESINGNVANFISFSVSEDEAQGISRNLFEGAIQKKLSLVLRSQSVHRCVLWSQTENGVAGPLSIIPSLSDFTIDPITFEAIREESVRNYGTIITENTEDDLTSLHEYLINKFEAYLKKSRVNLERGIKVNGKIPDGIFEYMGTKFIVEVEVSDILNSNRIKEKLRQYSDHRIIFLVPFGFPANVMETLLSEANLSKLAGSKLKTALSSVLNFSVVEVGDSFITHGLGFSKEMAMDDIFTGSVMLSLQNLEFPEIRKYLLEGMLAEKKVFMEYPAAAIEKIFGTENSTLFKKTSLRDDRIVTVHDLVMRGGEST